MEEHAGFKDAVYSTALGAYLGNRKELATASANWLSSLLMILFHPRNSCSDHAMNEPDRVGDHSDGATASSPCELTLKLFDEVADAHTKSSKVNAAILLVLDRVLDRWKGECDMLLKARPQFEAVINEITMAASLLPATDENVGRAMRLVHPCLKILLRVRVAKANSKEEQPPYDPKFFEMLFRIIALCKVDEATFDTSSKTTLISELVAMHALHALSQYWDEAAPHLLSSGYLAKFACMESVPTPFLKAIFKSVIASPACKSGVVKHAVYKRAQRILGDGSTTVYATKFLADDVLTNIRDSHPKEFLTLARAASRSRERGTANAMADLGSGTKFRVKLQQSSSTNDPPLYEEKHVWGVFKVLLEACSTSFKRLEACSLKSISQSGTRTTYLLGILKDVVSSVPVIAGMVHRVYIVPRHDDSGLCEATLSAEGVPPLSPSSIPAIAYFLRRSCEIFEAMPRKVFRSSIPEAKMANKLNAIDRLRFQMADELLRLLHNWCVDSASALSSSSYDPQKKAVRATRKRRVVILLKTILAELKGTTQSAVFSPSSPRAAKVIDVNAKRTLIVEACSILQFLTHYGIRIRSNRHKPSGTMLFDILDGKKNCSLSWDIIRGIYRSGFIKVLNKYIGEYQPLRNLTGDLQAPLVLMETLTRLEVYKLISKSMGKNSQDKFKTPDKSAAMSEALKDPYDDAYEEEDVPMTITLNMPEMADGEISPYTEIHVEVDGQEEDEQVGNVEGDDQDAVVVDEAVDVTAPMVVESEGDDNDEDDDDDEDDEGEDRNNHVHDPYEDQLLSEYDTEFSSIGGSGRLTPDENGEFRIQFDDGIAIGAGNDSVLRLVGDASSRSQRIHDMVRMFEHDVHNDETDDILEAIDGIRLPTSIRRNMRSRAVNSQAGSSESTAYHPMIPRPIDVEEVLSADVLASDFPALPTVPAVSDAERPSRASIDSGDIQSIMPPLVGIPGIADSAPVPSPSSGAVPVMFTRERSGGMTSIQRAFAAAAAQHAGADPGSDSASSNAVMYTEVPRIVYPHSSQLSSHQNASTDTDELDRDQRSASHRMASASSSSSSSLRAFPRIPSSRGHLEGASRRNHAQRDVAALTELLDHVSVSNESASEGQSSAAVDDDAAHDDAMSEQKEELELVEEKSATGESGAENATASLVPGDESAEGSTLDQSGTAAQDPSLGDAIEESMQALSTEEAPAAPASEGDSAAQMQTASEVQAQESGAAWTPEPAQEQAPEPPPTAPMPETSPIPEIPTQAEGKSDPEVSADSQQQTHGETSAAAADVAAPSSSQTPSPGLPMPPGCDPEVWASLPDFMQRDVYMQNGIPIPSSTGDGDNAGSSSATDDFLAALPEDIRNEVRAQQAPAEPPG